MSEYYWVLILSFSVPFIFSFSKRWGFHKHYKYAILSIILASIPFLIWDAIVTEIGHWSFNSDYISGLTIFNLPLEEILFFMVIPFCCTFTWNALNKEFGDKHAE
jgi:lycopene cyclase domain-containing protein